MTPSLRVWVTTHEDGHLSGILMRKVERPFAPPLPSAFGEDEAQLLRQLEATLGTRVARGEALEDYAFTETLTAATTRVKFHPWTAVKGRAAIGARDIPLTVGYAWAPQPQGGFLIQVPRFGTWFVVDELRAVRAVISTLLASHLMGASHGQLFDLRRRGPEYVLEWAPRMLEARSHEEGGDAAPGLRAVAEEWVRASRQRRLPPVVGALPALPRLLDLMIRERPASALLVGPSGAGKTAHVRRLARELGGHPTRGPDGRRRARRLWATRDSRLIAGMTWLGMWQQRVLDLVSELADRGDPLYVDHLLPIVAPQAGGASIADLLLPAMIAGEITVIAECSPEELARCRRVHPAATDAFTPVEIPAARPGEVGPLLADYHRALSIPTGLHPAALRRLVRHLDRLQPGMSFPGKGMRFLDWLAAQPQGLKGGQLLPNDLSRVFARYTGLPAALIADEAPLSAAAIAGALGAAVVGQPAACEAAGRILARFKAGLGDPERPIGSLLFVGPTGVGKTELSRQLARYLFGDPERLIRVDMSEYMLPGAARRLLEAGQGSRSLAAQVRAQPLSIILLDEIEKAHPQVFDLLLGALGHGRLTDDAGRLVDLRMTLIILTSNLGAGGSAAVGFGPQTGGGHTRAVRDFFRPELVGRLDAVVPFRPLDLGDAARIVDLILGEISGRLGLSSRRLRLYADDAARAALARLGHHPTRGARPLRRVIEEQVTTPIAVALAREPQLADREIWVVSQGDVASWRRAKAGAVVIGVGGEDSTPSTTLS